MAQPEPARIVRCLACREFISLDAPKCRFCGVAVDAKKYIVSLEREDAILRRSRRRRAWWEIASGLGGVVVGVVLFSFWLLKPGFIAVTTGLGAIGAGLYELLSENGWLAKRSIAPGTAIGVTVAMVLGGGFLTYTVGEYVLTKNKSDGFHSEQERRAAEIRKANAKDREVQEATLAAERKAVEIAQSAKTNPDAKGYRAGKIVILKKEVWHFDPLQESLPTELRAANPGEIGMVVVITSDAVKIGKYLPPDKSKADQYEVDAYKLETTVEVIDAALGTVVARQTYTTMPSNKVGVREYDSHVKIAEDEENPSSLVGKRPVREILKFILDLPVK